MKLVVCYFGIYNPSYSRNEILINGLKQNDVDVIECNSRIHGFRKYVDLIKKHRKIRGTYDVMVVGFPGYQSMIIAKFLTQKPILFDAFSLLHDSMVFDRKKVHPRSVMAGYYWFLDWLSMTLADIVLLDTSQHIEYASKEFYIRKNKFKRVFVGASTKIFKPGVSDKTPNEFRVLFYGSYIPLQGVQYIIEAAKLLEGKAIEFIIIGDGQEKNRIKQLIKNLNPSNVRLIDKIEKYRLPEEIESATVCLGIFGDTKKAQRVIPNKVYECLAMRKPVITADTPAIRELFDEKDLFLTKTADFIDLSQKILKLKNEKELRDNTAENGYSKFCRFATPRILGAELKNIIENITII